MVGAALRGARPPLERLKTQRYNVDTRVYIHKGIAMELQVNRWGNSLAVRLPAGLVKELGVQEGSTLSPHELGERLIALGKPRTAFDRKAFLQRLRRLHATMPTTRPLSPEELSRY